MQKPTRYFVEWLVDCPRHGDSCGCPPATEKHETNSRADAERVMRQTGGAIFERKGLSEDEEAPGTWWWEDVMVKDYR